MYSLAGIAKENDKFHIGDTVTLPGLDGANRELERHDDDDAKKESVWEGERERSRVRWSRINPGISKTNSYTY